jgi:thioredoxin 1
LHAAALATGLAAAGCAGEAAEGARESPHRETQTWFLGWPAVLILGGPILLAAVLAIRRARTRPSTLPRFDDESFETEVLGAQMPVLVHFARDWNVANRAALAQTELLAWQNRGAVRVGILDVETCPRTMARFPGLEPPAYLLFHRGRKLFHRPGLRQAGDLQEEIDVALSREGF